MTKNPRDRLDVADEALQPAGISAKILVGQAIERNWGWVLNIYETRLLQRICDITVQWGRTDWTTTLGQIIEGNITTKAVLPPIGFSRRTCEAALAKLVSLGVVEATVVYDQKGSKAGYRFRPDVELLIRPREKVAVLPVLREPNRLKTDLRTSCATPTQHMRKGYAADAQGLRTSCVDKTSNQTDTYTFNEDSGSADASPAEAGASTSLGFFGFDDEQLSLMPLPENETMQRSRPEKSEGITSIKGSAEKIQAEMDAIRTRNASLRATALQNASERVRAAKPLMPGKRARRGEDTVQPDDLWTIWKATYAAAAPDSREPLAWTKKERGLCLNLFRRWPHRHDGTKPNGEFDDFLAWVITEWRAIVSKHLGWMKAPPKTPNINVLHRFCDKFESAFVERDRLKVASRFDIDEVTELRFKGMSYDRAIQFVVDRKVRIAVGKIAASKPKSPPPARFRTPRLPLQPVAPKPDMPKREDRLSEWRKKSPEEVEAEIWGPKAEATA